MVITLAITQALQALLRHKTVLFRSMKRFRLMRSSKAQPCLSIGKSKRDITSIKTGSASVVKILRSVSTH
ncbi:Uncharacterised protein [Vibrio cholerae]|nr:Uncharacterised protein [Vibrio cholerae]CSI00029.1 Uncharacterised protein [Vibrio cholerae]